MKYTRTTLTMLGLAGAASLLGGCQVANTTTVTVMNETPSALLVDVMRSGSEVMVTDGDRLAEGGVQQFEVLNQGDAAVQIGIRPVEFEAAPARWVEFTQGGPYLLRVQGTATSLRFLPTEDVSDHVKAGDLDPIYTNRRMNEPPVQPSR